MLYNNLYKYVFVLVLKLINRKEENGTVDVIHSNLKVSSCYICNEKNVCRNEDRRTVKENNNEGNKVNNTSHREGKVIELGKPLELLHIIFIVMTIVF